MWILVIGRGEVDISTEVENLELLQPKNYRAKCHQTRPLFTHGPKIFCVGSHMVGYNKLCGVYLIFCLDLNYIMGSDVC